MLLLQVLLCLCALLQTSLSQENRRPFFDPGEYFGVRVTEGALADTHVVVVTAIDLDGDSITYLIEDGSEGFRDFKVDSTTGEVLVKSNGTLDRERQSRYRVTVTAFDNSDPPRQPGEYVSVTFDVLIADINDEEPRFQSPVTNLSVGEEITSGEIVTYVARDEDSGAGGYVTYEIRDETVPFSIGQDSGMLTVSGALDYDEPPTVYQFPIFATDNGDPQISSDIFVTIHINDFDDLPPKFTMPRYYQTLRENDTIGTLVHVVSAYDQDRQLNYPVVYDLEGVALEDNTALDPYLFSINASTGEVFTNHSLNYERVAKYIITVKATEQSSTRRSSTAVIELTIADLNDNFPVFVQPKYTMNVTENTRVEERVLTVTAEDIDGEMHNSFEYAIIEAEAREFFFIDASTGVITLVKALDFESTEMHAFTVIATETVGMGTNNGTTDVELLIVNENDEAPVFTELSYMAAIPENSDAGAIVTVVSSTDRDRPPYNARTYQFTANSSDTDRFEVDAITGEVRVSNESFPESPTLDFDGADNSFTLDLEVTDGMQTNYATLFINLEPVNDNPPMVDGGSQQFANVSEDRDDVVVHVLTAQDADTNADHSTLTWCITRGNEEEKFGLQNSIGDSVTITTISALDYESRTLYDLTIIVTDGENCSSTPDNGYFIDEVTVRVTVLDENDRPPVFSSDNYTFVINETQVIGSTVGNVSASDLDSDAILTYSINTGLFTIDNETGLITTAQMIDRESLQSNPVSFMVVVQDRHPTSNIVQSAMSMVTVWVNDVNDNSPRFSQPGGYSVSFEENMVGLTFSFSAVDADSGTNGEITYDIIDGDPMNKFSLRTNDSGEVTLEIVGYLDRENSTHYNLTILATDMGSPVMSTTAVIYVTVTDVNDEDPQFTRDFSTDIPETASPGSVVTTVNATDRDQGPNAQLSYFFAVNGQLESRVDVFRINQMNGEIQTTNILDRETQAVYDLMVVATDGGTEMRSGTTTVTVCVTDVNDNAPMFLDPTLARSVQEDYEVGVELYRVSTTDGDNIGTLSTSRCPSEGINSSVVYSLVFTPERNYSHLFEVNETTGSLFLISPLDYDTLDFEREPYLFHLQATDRNGIEPALSSLLPAVISVRPVNDNPPVFSNETYTISIKENTAIGTTHSLLEAMDADLGEQDSEIVYSSTITDPVEIDPRSGDLRVRGQLDFEGPNKSIEFTAVAYNPGAPDLNDTAIVTVLILDENDEAPVFENIPYDGSFSEGNYSTETQFGLQVSATDADSPLNSAVSFSLLDNLGGRFRIDNTTGTVYARGFFDAESGTTEYTLTVVATDSGTPAMSTTATATITILDVNDNSPLLDASQYSYALPENDNQARVLFTVSASDADINKNNNGRLQFTRVGDTLNAFDVNNTTGEVTYLGTVSFDKEATVDPYTFEVKVSDFGDTMLTSTASVSITIIDENDNKPMFGRAHYGNVSLMEDTAIDTVILVVSAEDSDQGDNGRVTYELVTDFGFFAVDSDSGNVTLMQSIDYETQAPFYMLSIMARDRGTPQLSDVATLGVIVTNAIDTAPVFSNAMYVGTLHEDADVDDMVLTVNVTDTENSATLSFSLLDNSLNRFKVSNDGVISANSAFDYEAGDRVFTFRVVASYSLSLAATASVTVRITDVNDHAPVFRVRPQYQAQITAGAAIGTTIFSILATDDDSGSNAAITYSFAPNVSSEVQRLFSLDNETGIMKITSDIVYNPNNFMFLFYVVATDRGDPAMSSVTEVLVIVTDDNINAPTFNQTAYMGSIKENELPGTDVLQVFAMDPEGNPITYRLTEGTTSSMYFRFDGNTIKTNAVLDREAVPTHTFTVLAEDNGQPPKMGFALVTITVLDVNDHPPVFGPVPFTFELTENPLVNQSVGVVEATDEDILENGEIVYSGSSANFMVDPTSGEILVVNPTGLDRERSSTFTLTIIARDKGTPMMSSDTQVTITLRDVNDEAPTFIGGPYTGMILEDSPQDNFVAAVNATDLDSGDAIDYAIEEGDDASEPKFFIDGQGRILTSANSLDREDVSQYSLIVTATDLVGNKGTTTVTVSVLDVNDNAPEFTVGSLYTIHREETYTEADVFITTLTATDIDSGNNREITYSVTSDPSGLFYFAHDTGNLFAECCVDRENTLFQSGDFGIYTINVTATDRADNPAERLSRTLKLTINVSDFNDNPPKFPLPAYTVSINETSPPNTMVITVMAVDPDFGTNSVVDYSLTGSNLFTVDAVTGVVRVIGDVRFSTTGTRSHELTIVARDRGAQPMLSSVDVTVQIIDENDNAPRFSPTLYLETVVESSTPGTEVVVVTATDSDLDAVIRYQLVDTFGKFHIDPVTGSLTLITTLDREVNQSYTVLVVATDSPTEPQSATATVQVTVGDINDNSPSFTQNFYAAEVEENSRGGVLVAEVSASDVDDGSNGMVRYTLTGTGAENFDINENTGIVTVSNTANLDKESVDDYVLTVTARDSGDMPRNASAEITITLINVNDNPPTFSQANYPLFIPEDFYEGFAKATTFQVSASDLDQDMNLRYSITAGADNLFDIGQSNGSVIVIGELDREAKMEYILIVTVTDSGPVAFRGTATVTVTLTDVNDNAPVFTEAVYRASINEASTDSTQFIVRVSASDADSGNNAAITYSLTDYTNLFDINTDNGDVFTKREPFDREYRDSYTVTVVAMDAGSPKSLNASASIVITLDDVNDGIPYFDQPQYIVDVVVPLINGRPFARLVANDDDIGSNAELEYRLSSNPYDFILNDSTPGLIVANSNLSAALAETSYTLVLSAIDRGSPRRTGTTSLLVNFLMENDTRPIFGSSLIEISVPENDLATQRDAFIVRTSVTIVFDFQGFSPNNTILSETRAIGDPVFEWSGSFHVIQREFDREEREFYSLNVRAGPSSMNLLDGYAILFVTIMDENDNIPVFQNDPYFAEVTEGVDNGFNTGIVVIATDRDKDDFGTVSYSLTKNENSTFSIDATTGVLTVSNSVDRESNPTYELIVEARDGGGMAVSAPIIITVADINDNAPVFQGQFDSTIPESFPLVDTVVTVVANDLDDGINSRLTYSFGPAVDPELPFFIDASTGVIRTARDLDFDSGERSYSIVVIATDGGLVPQSASTSVQITITDVNDCTPTFEQASFTVFISENAEMGAVVQDVIVSDCDTGENSNITYSITKGNQDQKFHVVNGIIQVNEELDFEQNQQFTLTVVARDNGEPSLSSSAELTVFITDVNDNSPKFTEISLPVEISEATSPLSTIATVSATDADSGDNARIKFYISDQSVEGLFVIDDQMTGIITLASGRSLDRDQFSVDTSVHHWVYVAAEDSGSPQMTTFYNVTIRLLDINDNPPQLLNISATCDTSAPSDASVKEGADTGTIVFQVDATDVDADLNAALSYTITGGNTGEVFRISTDDGQVTVNTPPDRENELGSINSYTLTIEVADRGTPQLTRTGCLQISVEDINDFPPTFNQESYSGMVTENVVMDTILTIIATDRDKAETPNAEITFSWCAEDPDNFVMRTIADNTIGIGNSVGLDCEDQSHYELCITAANVAGEPPMAANATIVITCTDINDNPPMFNSTRCEALLNETSPIQETVVTTLSAYDNDQPGSQNSDLVWLAPTVDNPFHLDASTGVITVQSPLDHEANPEYSLTYTVRDSGTTPLSSTIVCTFTIVDENDNAPVFAESPFNVTVLEGTTPSSLVTVTATDNDDLQQYTDAWFSISGWSPGEDVVDLFTIARSTGEISLNQELDREIASQYTVSLMVTNTERGVCPNSVAKDCVLSSQGSLVVTVSDVNDNPPVFSEKGVYTADLPSSSNPGYNVKQVVAMDADDGINSLVMYSLQEPANVVRGTFDIDSESGQITLVGSVQQYEGDTLMLTVIARDREGQEPYNEARANVSITVVGDIQRIALQYSCNQTYVNAHASNLRSILEALTNLTIPYVVVTGDGEESIVTLFAQDPQTNLLVSFDELERLLFDNYLTIQEAVPPCTLLSIKSDIGDAPAPTLPSVTELIPLFALCGVVAAGACVVQILAANQRRATRRQRKKEYLGNIFFGTATDVDGGGGGLMQLEQVGATEEITHENPVFIDPFKKWENVDASREASHVVESAVSLTRNPAYESQEIRMEMFQEGADSELGGEDDELLAEALRDESDDEDDILVTAI